MFSLLPAFFIATALALILSTSGTGAQPSNAAIGGAGSGLKLAKDGRLLIERIAPGGPAAKAGIQVGDWLVGVDERAVSELDGAQLVDAIRGPAGSKVVLLYVRGNAAPVPVTVTREVLGPPPVPQTESPPLRPLSEKPSAPTQRPAAVAPRALGTIKLTQIAIKDPSANGVTAITFLRPHGWQSEGQIAWLPEFSVLANLRLRLSDPITATTIDWLPTQHFSFTDQLPGLMQPGANWMGAIFAAPVTDPAQFVEGFWTPQVLPQLRNLRPMAREDFPAIARQSIASNPGWQAQSVRLRYAFEQ